MLKIIKNLLILVFLGLLSCVNTDEPVDNKDLVFEFENIWWEIIDEPAWLVGGGVYCYYFDTTRIIEEPDDGVILYYEEGDAYSYVLSNFERIENGYYLSKYEVILEIFIDEDNDFSGKLSNGLVSHQTKIIPCGLGS